MSVSIDPRPVCCNISMLRSQNCLERRETRLIGHAGEPRISRPSCLSIWIACWHGTQGSHTNCCRNWLGISVSPVKIVVLRTPVYASFIKID